MTVKERISAIRLCEKITQHKTFAEKIKLSVKMIPATKPSETVIVTANKH